MYQTGNKIFDFNIVSLFITVSLIYIILNYLNNLWLFNDQFYYRLLDANSNSKEIDRFIHANNQFVWVKYLVIPIVLLLKISIIAAVIFGTTILYNRQLSFRSVFKIVLLAELVMIIASIWRLTYFLVRDDSSVLELRYYYPLSLVQIYNPAVIPSYLIYPLQIINLFEFLYCMVLSSGLAVLLKNRLKHGIQIVMSGYGVCLVLWVLIIIFIQLQIISA